MCKPQNSTHPLIGKNVRYRKRGVPKEAVVVSSRSFKYLSGDEYTLLMLDSGDEVNADGCAYEFSPGSFESARELKEIIQILKAEFSGLDFEEIVKQVVRVEIKSGVGL